MRVLHTADWHIGKTLARRCRLDETRAALDEVVGIAVAEEVDAVLVCGDVFEHQAPTAECEGVAYRTLLRLHEAGIPVVVIPGNHDHADRWGALKPLFDHCSVRVVPKPARPPEGIVTLPGRNGGRLQVAALPWVSERRMQEAAELLGLEGDAMQGYAGRMQTLIAKLCEGLDPSCCTVLAAHVFMSGADPSGSERPLTVGQVYAVEPQALPSVQYAALGHIHFPQQIKGTLRQAFYSGSLLQLDFGEAGQQKQVNLVDLEPGRPAQMRAVGLTAGRRLRTVEGTLEELEQYRDTQDTEWLRVRLRCGGPAPGLAEQVREVLPHALEVGLEYPRDETQPDREVRGLTPREQFAEYHRRRVGGEVEPETLDLFDALLEEAA